jgi:hypothetical protein
LEESSPEIKNLDTQIAELLSSTREISLEEGFRAIVKSIPKDDPGNFSAAKDKMATIMELVARELSKQWNNDRYVRGKLNLDS